MKKKAMYVSPQIEVIEVENEGVIAASGGLSNIPDGGGVSNTSSRSYQGGSASSDDLDDLINDILTVEQ